MGGRGWRLAGHSSQAGKQGAEGSATPSSTHLAVLQSHPKFKNVAEVAPLLYSRALQVRFSGVPL